MAVDDLPRGGNPDASWEEEIEVIDSQGDSYAGYRPTDAHRVALDDLIKIVEVLFGDVNLAGRQLPEGGQEARRRYIRNIMAVVEGVTAAMRRIALADAEAGITDFSEGDRAILREVRYELRDGGTVRSIPSYQKPAPMVRFSFAALAKTYRIEHSLAVGDNGWERFQKVVDVRNKLVHPNTPEDLEVSIEQLQDAYAGVKWFHGEALRLVRAAKAALKPEEEGL